MGATIAYGQQAISTSAVRVISSSQDCSAVVVKASPENTVRVYLGTDNAVTSSTGVFLDPGDVYVWGARDTSTLFGITTSGTATVSYSVEK